MLTLPVPFLFATTAYKIFIAGTMALKPIGDAFMRANTVAPVIHE